MSYAIVFEILLVCCMLLFYPVVIAASSSDQESYTPKSSPPLYKSQEHGTYFKSPQYFSLGASVDFGPTYPSKSSSRDEGLLILMGGDIGYTKHLSSFGAYFIGADFTLASIAVSASSVVNPNSIAAKAGYLFPVSTSSYGMALYVAAGPAFTEYSEHTNNIEFYTDEMIFGFTTFGYLQAYLYVSDTTSMSIGAGYRYYRFYIKDLKQNPTTTVALSEDTPKEGDSFGIHMPFAKFSMNINL